MILQHAFTVYDKVSNRYSTPYFCVNREDYLRQFEDVLTSPGENNPYVKHPDDYVLYEIGTFDLEEGELGARQLDRKIGSVKDLFGSTLERIAQKAPPLPKPPITA